MRRGIRAEYRRNDANRPRAICPNETVGAVPVCLPERPRSGVSITKIHALCAGMNDGCALVGRHGRAHRHRPYQSPSYFSTQFDTNKITIYAQSTPTKPTAHTQSSQTKCVGAVPVCPPERPHSGVSIQKTHCARGITDGCALVGRHGRAHRHRPYQSPSNIAVCHYPLYIR